MTRPQSKIFSDNMQFCNYFDFNISHFKIYNIFCIGNNSINQNTEIEQKLRKFEIQIFENLKIFDQTQTEGKWLLRMSVNAMKNIVHKIFPLEIFGSKKNFKKFLKLITKYCTTTVYENIPYNSLYTGWNLSEVTWLSTLQEDKKAKEIVVTKVIIWLLQIFKTRILKKLFFIQPSRKSYKIKYYPKNKYKSLYSKCKYEMLKKGQLISVPADKSDELKKPTTSTRICKSKLLIYPRKKMTSYRPILRSRLLRDIDKEKVKCLLKDRGAIFNRNLYTAWSDFVEKNSKERIYGVKIDLRDAFSNVDIENLKPFIRKFLKPVPAYRDAILNSLEGQTVKMSNKKFYIWNRGLMQGMRFSAQLCDLSRSFFDKKYLFKHIANSNNFFYRTCDDYFFCSTDKEQVQSFKDILTEKAIIATEKTKDNLDSEDNKILFNGRLFNLETKEVEIFINPKIKTFRYKSKLFYDKIDPSEPIQYLKNVVSLRTNSYHFNKILLNVNFNSIETVYQNFFKAMLIVAFKMDWAIKERLNKIPELHCFIENLVKYYVSYTRRVLITTKKNPEVPMNVQKSILKWIGIKAFILALQKRYLAYKETIIALKKSIKGFYHPQISNKFNKLPHEFQNIKMKRVLDKYK